ncbi:MAG TPA: helix-turn-helix transcriptional regulator [Bryobacteraceae bacterium]|nr:helix-turn-helix transcriptional regulator [Bryobacteraceae bacterium]
MTEYDPKRGVSVATLAYEYPSSYQVGEHAHGSDQLIYAISGVMEVSAGQSVWLIPPHFALWIPARTRHRIHMPGPVSMRTLYLRTGLTARADPRSAVLAVTPLLRELIIEIVRVRQLRIRSRYECALRDLLIPQLEKASPIPTFVTLPREARALAVAQAILKNPAESKSLATLCAGAGVSVRTIERAFQKEVGINFESWRRQVRLTKAVELLVSGCSIKEVAFKIGYHQSSTFVEMFRHTFGTTPKAWVSVLEIFGQRSTEPEAELSLSRDAQGRLRSCPPRPPC